jgi:hypothetical protein
VVKLENTKLAEIIHIAFWNVMLEITEEDFSVFHRISDIIEKYALMKTPFSTAVVMSRKKHGFTKNIF